MRVKVSYVDSTVEISTTLHSVHAVIIVHEIGREQSCILLESLASKSNFIASNPRMLTSVMINAIYLQATMEGIGIPSRVARWKREDEKDNISNW
ncbi:hypothetical protein QVD17_11459 [Tagetes erecta]|uniref:Uncharacterized protein n=1 Tax=Tagetes erecta TaxID=13708 RepID=A0AAD8KUH3_TARER|nr:hypothetical protein QVD17_11459 [Tagetes erecta]